MRRLNGWWSVAYRVSNRTMLVREDEAPDGSTVLADVGAALAARGLSSIGSDLPGIALLTYTNLDLGYEPWTVWSTDRETGEADLNAKATQESFFEGSPAEWGADSAGEPTPAPVYDIAENARGARRLAGAVERVVVTVGLSEDQAATLESALDGCRFEHRTHDQIDAAGCASLLPTLVLVAAHGEAGDALLRGLEAEEGVRAPVVAVTPGGEMRAGGDATVDAGEPPDVWAPLLRDLLR